MQKLLPLNYNYFKIRMKEFQLRQAKYYIFKFSNYLDTNAKLRITMGYKVFFEQSKITDIVRSMLEDT